MADTPSGINSPKLGTIKSGLGEYKTGTITSNLTSSSNNKKTQFVTINLDQFLESNMDDYKIGTIENVDYGSAGKIEITTSVLMASTTGTTVSYAVPSLEITYNGNLLQSLYPATLASVTVDGPELLQSNVLLSNQSSNTLTTYMQNLGSITTRGLDSPLDM